MSKGWLISILAATALVGQNPKQIMDEVQRRSKADSQHYEGTLEVSNKDGGKVATKRWIFDRIGSFGNSKAVLRFTVPADVKGVGLLIFNHAERASDQWMWRPNIGREQRIALQDRSTRFFGTDFSFEDLEERDVAQYDYSLLGEENGHWKVESKPRKSSQYTHSYLWVSKDRYLITRVEAYNKKGLVRSTEYRDFEQIQNIWTARTVDVTDVPRQSRTVLKYDKLNYNTPMKEDAFTLEALRRGA